MSRMNVVQILGIVIFSFLIISIQAQAVNVVCSIPDFVPIVKSIGGDKVNVTSIMPPGSDPHSFTLTKAVMDNMENSDLILLVNSNFLHFEEKIKERYGYKCLDFKDYEENGATLDSFPRFKVNPHGYWLKLDNGIAIAKTLTKALISLSPKDREYFNQNLYVFIREVEDSKNITESLISEYELKDKTCVAVVPGVCYIIQNMGMRVGDVLLGEELGFASGKSITEIEKKLVKDYDFIVIPEFMKNSKAGEIAKQLSKDAGKPVVYVKFVMAEKNESYLALHYKNLIQFARVCNYSTVEKVDYGTIFTIAFLLLALLLLLKLKGVV